MEKVFFLDLTKNQMKIILKRLGVKIVQINREVFHDKSASYLSWKLSRNGNFSLTDSLSIYTYLCRMYGEELISNIFKIVKEERGNFY